MTKIRWSLITTVFLLILKGITLSQDIVFWDQADKYYGKNVTIEGTIVSTVISKKGKVCFLNFGSEWQQGLTAVIFRGDMSKFPDNPREFYQGKKVRVTGVVQQIQGKPEIILNDPSQIEVLE